MPENSAAALVQNLDQQPRSAASTSSLDQQPRPAASTSSLDQQSCHPVLVFGASAYSEGAHTHCRRGGGRGPATGAGTGQLVGSMVTATVGAPATLVTATRSAPGADRTTPPTTLTW